MASGKPLSPAQIAQRKKAAQNSLWRFTPGCSTRKALASAANLDPARIPAKYRKTKTPK